MSLPPEDVLALPLSTLFRMHEDDGGELVLPQLKSSIQRLSGDLGERVSEQYESMLSNVHATHALEKKLLRSNGRVEALALTVRRIRGLCSRPCVRLQECVAQLERMQESAELLRQTQRALVLFKRLHESGVAAMAAPPAGGDGAAGVVAPPASKPTGCASMRATHAASACHPSSDHPLPRSRPPVPGAVLIFRRQRLHCASSPTSWRRSTCTVSTSSTRSCP